MWVVSPNRRFFRSPTLGAVAKQMFSDTGSSSSRMTGLTLIKDTKNHVGLAQQSATARRTIPDTGKSLSLLH